MEDLVTKFDNNSIDNGIDDADKKHSPNALIQIGISSGIAYKRLQNPVPESFWNEIDYLKLILTANVYPVAIESPLQSAYNLSAKLKNNISLKREDLQPVFSFKIRGAFNKIQSLTTAERERGLCAPSAGNHAQALALSAQKLNCKATIVMPVCTPQIKVNNVARLGANVVLEGNDFNEAKAHCMRLIKENNYVLIPPFDDPMIIAGVGTIAVEISRQTDMRNVHAIFACCGGGGLLSGIALYMKRLYPHVKIIGVEHFEQAKMTLALLNKELTTVNEPNLFADGTAVSTAGLETFRICRHLVDEMVVVTNDEICAAIKDTFEDTRSILEPSGALALAGCKRWIAENKSNDANLIAVCSGANMDFSRLRFVTERCDIGQEKEGMIHIVIPEVPGTFLKMINIINRPFVELSYRFNDSGVKANVFASFTINDKSDTIRVIDQLKWNNMEASDMSDNELMKSHLKFLGGGRCKVENEVIFRFEFRERTKYLQYLYKSFNKWNMTLCHLRSIGGDVVRVLIGLQVPEEEKEELIGLLDNTKLYYVEETENTAYQAFLIN